MRRNDAVSEDCLSRKVTVSVYSPGAMSAGNDTVAVPGREPPPRGVTPEIGLVSSSRIRPSGASRVMFSSPTTLPSPSTLTPVMR